MKVAVLRLNAVVAESRAGKTAEKTLAGQVEKLQAELKAKQREATKAKAEARQPSNAADPAKQQEAGRLEREAEHLGREAEIQVESLRQELLNDVLVGAHKEIEALAKEREADLVMLAPNPGLAYFNPALDITNDLIARLDGPRTKES
jgi:Skp family chaperone for outer membrane proteins